MTLSRDEVNFLDNVVFSKENIKSEFEEWVDSFELYLKENGRDLYFKPCCFADYNKI